MFLFLSSDDLTTLCENNHWNDFLVPLPSSYYFDRLARWKCGLVDLLIESDGDEVEITKWGYKPLFVYCDLVEPSVSLGSMEPRMRMVQLNKVVNRIETFNPTYYMDINRERVSAVRVYIRSCNKAIPSLTNAITRCTLHLLME